MNKKQKAIIEVNDKTFEKRFYQLFYTKRKVQIKGIGVFEFRKMPKRKIFDINKGKVVVKQFSKIVFRPTKELKDFLT